MKRLIATLLAAVTILSLTACEGGHSTDVNSGNAASTQDTEGESDVPDTESSNSSATEPSDTPEQTTSESKILVKSL